ncbi:Protein of unknown function [Lactobacillus helveticus CIRM-BIA 953]|uniref:Uncharacterized protein n=1 Tax=Lactobacillus helveticus CIRM-BIA 953 TaxID=1226335 RepID=U4QM41_LACHE|nr:Protein of unknown function [Lactobacillus helveticus CIRM-BIA 953]CDI41947.1 Protein of unknown function [Lactobacillus helveticus CIRM-BIA 953]CDI42070.1 Protein of unknown function [Lactobacillus helveticus CIRM-BIA 953]CDI42355.1 Protein of unknown function [Lactobacillus helveticus CIRM-BIA 953]CDI42436.1 Protein of unknown function [Lactobacillus helveticus CIRM-BIA 953]
MTCGCCVSQGAVCTDPV